MTPSVEVHAFAQVAAPDGPLPATGGIGADLALGGRVFGTLGGDVGPAGDDAWGVARLGLGVVVAPSWSIRAAAGPSIRYDARGLWSAVGVARDVGQKIRWRFGADAVFGGAPGAWQGGLRVTVGITDTPRARPAPPSSPPPPPAGWTFEPADARIWVPHPVCDWLTPEEFAAEATALPPDVVARAFAPGRLPSTVPGRGGAVALDVAPDQGSVVLAAAPGDRVAVGGIALAGEADALYVVNLPPGRYAVEAVGGGRRFVRDVDVAVGEAAWVAAPQPGEQRVYFDAGQSALRADTRAALAAWQGAAGDARLVISGGASPEGEDDANRKLAAARAWAVYEALLALGVPADRLRVGPVLPQSNLEPALQRVVILTPEAP